MSRRELADAVNTWLWRTYQVQDRLDETDIGRLERGEHRWPGARRREAFRAVLRVETDADLGFYVNRGAQGRDAQDHSDGRADDPDRTKPIAPVSTLAEVDLLEDVQEIDARRQRSTTSNVDEAMLTYLGQAIQRIIEDNERRPPRLLLPRTRQLRRHVDQLLVGRQHPPQRARLYEHAAYLSGLLSALTLDVGAFRLARIYGAEAFELADAVEDPNLQAWARGVQSLIAYYAGDFHDALAYAQDGIRRSPRGPHSIRLAINGEARALARLGDRYGVDEAVARAFARLEDEPALPDVSASLTTGPYCHARTAANAATAYLSVGAVHRVPEYVAQSLVAFDRAELRGPQALSRLDLATAAIQHTAPDIEHACALAAEALTLTADQQLESVGQRARQFLAAARPFGEQPALRHVAELAGRRDRPRALPSAPLRSPP